MLTRFGTQPTMTPEGMLRPLHWPSLATMDQVTGDGRILDSGGRGVRDLPRTVYAQFVNQQGHEGSVIVGSLNSVAFHDDGTVEGWGWALDDDNGRQAIRYISAGALRHNSIDLADAKARYELTESGDDVDLVIRFTEWKIAATTLVGKPAFADASVELDDEVTAALYGCDIPLEITAASQYPLPDEELTASVDCDTAVAWADFHRPEAELPTKIVVDDAGRVFGHLALWDSRHEGYPNRLVRPPRPSDNYASFNKPGPLTELGQVETGPLFFAGGHPKAPLGGRDPFEAYGDVSNCWADVRVIAGVHGPWISGRVRPGVDDETVYAARCSRISGHWVGDRLRAIVSCNVEAFDVPGSGFTSAGFSARYADVVQRDGTVVENQLVELVASFPPEPAVGEAGTAVDPTWLAVTSGAIAAPAMVTPWVEAVNAALAHERKREIELLALSFEFDDDDV